MYFLVAAKMLASSSTFLTSRGLRMYSWILCLIISFNVFALSTETKIIKISEEANQRAMIYGFDGKVYFLPEGVQLDQTTKEHEDHTFAIEFDEQTNEVQSFVPVDKEEVSAPKEEIDFTALYIDDRDKPEVFYLSEYQSEADLFRTFSRQNTNINHEAQCFDKAHYWSHEWARQNLSSGKLFLFFTESYIRRYNYKWWFHVAPTFQVNPGQVRVMDPIFARSPLAIQDWTNLFVQSKAKCPSINHYNEYYHNQQTRDCYVRHTSKFYYHPSTIQNRDLTGRPVTRWNQAEVGTAYGNVNTY